MWEWEVVQAGASIFVFISNSSEYLMDEDNTVRNTSGESDVAFSASFSSSGTDLHVDILLLYLPYVSWKHFGVKEESKWAFYGMSWLLYLSCFTFCLPPTFPSFPTSFCHHFFLPIWSFSTVSLSSFACLSLSKEPFFPSCWLSPSLMLHYLLCGNAQNCLPLLIIRCIRQGHGLVSGSDSPSASWESGREETWRGGTGGKDKGGGSLCPIVSALCVSV